MVGIWGVVLSEWHGRRHESRFFQSSGNAAGRGWRELTMIDPANAYLAGGAIDKIAPGKGRPGVFELKRLGEIMEPEPGNPMGSKGS